jgi:hypothetical protein
MTRSDFGDKCPTNHQEILQFVNNLILYQEECVFWTADPDSTDSWELDLIARYLSGDRTGNLRGAPDPIY